MPIFHTLSKRMGIIWMRNVALKAVPIRVLFIKYIVHGSLFLLSIPLKFFLLSL